MKTAFFEWLGSLTVGLLPLVAHGLLHIFGNPIKDWDDNWEVRMTLEMISLAASILAALVAISVGRGSVRAMRRRTGDNSALTRILSGALWDGRHEPRGSRDASA